MSPALPFARRVKAFIVYNAYLINNEQSRIEKSECFEEVSIIDIFFVRGKKII